MKGEIERQLAGMDWEGPDGEKIVLTVPGGTDRPAERQEVIDRFLGAIAAQGEQTVVGGCVKLADERARRGKTTNMLYLARALDRAIDGVVEATERGSET